MAKKQVVENLENSNDVVISSLRDAAYKQSKSYDDNQAVLQKVKNYIATQCPSWPEKENAEVEAELESGYKLRYGELHPAKSYAFKENAAGQKFFADVSDMAKRPDGTVEISVSYATGLSNYDLRKVEPAEKKKVVQTLRNECSTYVSGRMKDLKNAIKGKAERKRAENKTLQTHWVEFFKADEKKITHAKTLGDPHADMVTYKLAVDAFWKVINDRIKL